MDTGDQLADPADTAQRPVHQFRGVVGSGLSTGDAEHGVLQHRRPDDESFWWAGGSAGENRQRTVDAGTLPAGVALGEGPHRRAQRQAGSPDAGCRRRHGVGPVLRIGEHGGDVQAFDVRGDGLGRLKRVDHRHRTSGRHHGDGGGRMRVTVAHHKADGLARGQAGVTQAAGDGGAVAFDLITAMPVALELDTRPATIARQPCRKPFGKAFGHQAIVHRGCCRP